MFRYSEAQKRWIALGLFLAGIVFVFPLTLASGSITNMASWSTLAWGTLLGLMVLVWVFAFKRRRE